jgi:hypothetical protein
LSGFQTKLQLCKNVVFLLSSAKFKRYIPIRQLKVPILKWPIPVADSAESGHFLEESDDFEYIMYIKD